MELKDTDLIARVLADDDRHAFAELLRRHQSMLRGFLRRLTGGDDALADDLAQEACIAAYRNLAKYSGAQELMLFYLEAQPEQLAQEVQAGCSSSQIRSAEGVHWSA